VFLYAVRLEALGYAQDACREYRTHLRQRGGAHTEEAKKHLEGVAP
jgi:hypothetical protein